MKRRSFFGFVGGAVAAGPAAVSQAAEAASKVSLSGLYVPKPNKGELDLNLFNEDPVKKAKRDLKREFTERSAESVERARNRYSISALDPNIASLRSVSLPNKIRITRDIDFNRSREERRIDLIGIIEGWWKY